MLEYSQHLPHASMVTYAHLGAFCYSNTRRFWWRTKTLKQSMNSLTFFVPVVLFRKNDIFYNSVSFQNIMDIYNFDYELRHIIPQYVEIIEVQMKSLFSYEFTRLHGPLGYLNEEFFTDTLKYKQIIKKANMQAMKRLPNEAYLKHFIKETEHPLPLWVYVDLLTISDISILYSISENKIKNAVALNFGLM